MDHIRRLLIDKEPPDMKVTKLNAWLDISREKMDKQTFELLCDWLCTVVTSTNVENRVFDLVEKLLIKEINQPSGCWIKFFENTHSQLQQRLHTEDNVRQYAMYLKMLRNFVNSSDFDGSANEFLTKTALLIVQNLESPPISQESGVFPKFLATNVNLLSSVVLKSGDVVSAFPQKILSCLKFYLFIGVSPLKYPIPSLHSSGIAIDFDTDKRSSGQRLALSKRKQNTPKKQKTVDVDSEVTDHCLQDAGTSDSEIDDNEGRSAKSLLADARVAVAKCLVNVFHCVPYAVLVPFWSHFLADESATYERPKLTTSLIWFAGRDPDFRVRTAAYHVISLILLRGAVVWKTADYFALKSFTTFASTLASYAVTIQKYFLQFLRTERANNARVAGIKCLTDYISVMPSKKLPKDTVVDILRVCSRFLEHEWMDTRVTALVLFRTALTIEDLEIDTVLTEIPSVPELRCASSQSESGCEEVYEVDSEDIDSRVTLDDSGESVNSSWLANYALAVLEKSMKNVKISSICVIECATILGELCRTRFYLVENQLSVLFYTLKKCFSSSNDSFVQVRVIKSIGRIFAAVSQRFPHIKVNAEKHIDEICLFWGDYIQDILFQVVRSQQATVEAEAVTSLVFIGSEILDILPSRQKIMCETLLLELSSSEFFQVRSSAVRVLGTWTSYSCMEDEVIFFLDSCDAIIRLSADPKCAENAVWALSAVTDKFSVFQVTGEVPENLPSRLFVASLVAFEKFKLFRTHSVRALGNSCSSLSEKDVHLNSESIDKAINLIRETVVNGQRDKLRWNACYSAGKIFRNPILISKGVESLLPAILQVLETSKNFKIRIQAANSLLNITSWKDFGPHWTSVWKSLLMSCSAGTEFCPNSEIIQLNNFLKTVTTVIEHLLSSIDSEVALVAISSVLLDYAESAAMGLNRSSREIAVLPNFVLDLETRHPDLIVCLRKILCD